MLPENHPKRFVLNDEVHARPSESLPTPLHLSYLALICDRSAREYAWQHMCDLAQRYGVSPPAQDTNHFSADFGDFRLKWEQHTEYNRYKFIVKDASQQVFAEPAISALPEDWLATLPGQTIVAAHATLLSHDEQSEPLNYEQISKKNFNGNVLIGSAIADGAATALTDFRISDDGFSRLLIHNHGMNPRQTGRMMQRLLEIDTYRIMALMALPVARELTPFLDECENELSQLTNTLANTSTDIDDEQSLLDSLTRLAVDIESRESETHFRFSAARAYYVLVQRRINELREQRIPGLQTFREFTERRLAPAMSTCTAVAARQESLTQRVTRVTQLLSTRVDIARERQTQAVLESMNRRAKLQLRLQETVEGLSIAAVTYYIVGLVNYLVKSLKASGLAINVDLMTGISIPVVAVIVAIGVRKIRKTVASVMN